MLKLNVIAARSFDKQGYVWGMIQMKHMIAAALAVVLGTATQAGTRDEVFANIDGGTLQLSDWAGSPVLVVNTASECGFTRQYDGLQKLYDRYRARGLVVLAVPSGDFEQELASGAEVKEFCEVSFGLDMPMADISSVKGAGAHGFYKAVQEQTGFVPNWNFNKVLIGADGQVLDTWRASTRPTSRAIIRAIEPLLE